MTSRVCGWVKWSDRERIEKTGFTIIGASNTNAPLVDECKAHLEWRLHGTQEVGSGFVVFGEIVAASIWDRILDVEPGRRYEVLGQIVFLEAGMFARISEVAGLE